MHKECWGLEVCSGELIVQLERLKSCLLCSGFNNCSHLYCTLFKLVSDATPHKIQSKKCEESKGEYLEGLLSLTQ